MDAITRRLKKAEGYSLTPYKDTNGYWTIGRGHRIRKHFKPNLKWTHEEVEEQFRRDVYAASDEFMRVKRKLYPALDVVRSEACVEMIFWMGLRGFLGFKEMQKALAIGDYILAGLELYNSKIGRDQKLRGRARRLAQTLWEG